jgi:STE24 endopeptidase
MSSRWFAVAALVALGIAILAVVVLRVPWDLPPAARADQLAALRELPADAVARGRQFHATLRPGSYAGLLAGLLVALVLGLTPLGARIVAAAGRPFGGHWLAEALLGGLAVALAGELVTLPIATWRHTVLRRYGLSTQDWAGWAVDLAKGYAIGALLAAVALAGFFTVTRFLPRWWWAVAAPGAAALVTLLMFVFPVLVEPVFNTFTPMEPGPLRTRLIAMARADGVPVRDVLVADASRRTRGLNAYVSGLGPTRRVVVYDTLLERAPEDEVASVVAHELGHAAASDTLIGTLLAALGTATGVIGLYLLGSWTGLLHRAGVDAISEPRAVALLLALVTVAGLLSGPAQGLLSRRIEARADAHALALTRDPATFEAMQRRLMTTNLGEPDPPRLEYWLFATHPSTIERIAAARAYHRKGEP